MPLTERHNTLIREMHSQADQLDAASTNQAAGFETAGQPLQDVRRYRRRKGVEFAEPEGHRIDRTYLVRDRK